MNCPRCKHSLTIGEGICPECGYNTEGDAAFLNLKSRTVSEMKKQFSSPLFLAFAIILSVITLSYALFAIEAAVTSPLLSVAVFAAVICSAISTVFAFMLYFSKGKAKASSVKCLNVYYTAMVILSVMECILAGIVSGFTLVICLILAVILLIAKNATETIDKLFGGIELGELSITEVLDGGSAIIAICGILISALVIFVFVCKVLAFKKCGKYVCALSRLCDVEEYSVKRAPSVGLWMYGVISILISLIGFAFGIGCGVAFIMTGALMIVSALFFAKMHKCSCNSVFTDAAEKTETVQQPVQSSAPAPKAQPTQGYAPHQGQQARPTQGYAPYQPQGGAQYNAQPAPTQRYAPYQAQPTQGYAPAPQGQQARPTQGYTPYQAQPTQGYAPYQPTQPMQGYAPQPNPAQQTQGYVPYQPTQPVQGYAPQPNPTQQTQGYVPYQPQTAPVTEEKAEETVTETETKETLTETTPEIAAETMAQDVESCETVTESDAPETETSPECESTDEETNG